MESNTAETTFSTSRWLRSGKSLHSFCTSSERIIEVPVKIANVVTPPPALGDCVSACRTKEKGADALPHPRPSFCVVVGRKCPTVSGLLLRLLFAGFFQGCPKDVAEAGTAVGRA